MNSTSKYTLLLCSLCFIVALSSCKSTEGVAEDKRTINDAKDSEYAKNKAGYKKVAYSDNLFNRSLFDEVSEYNNIRVSNSVEVPINGNSNSQKTTKKETKNPTKKDQSWHYGNSNNDKNGKSKQYTPYSSAPVQASQNTYNEAPNYQGGIIGGERSERLAKPYKGDDPLKYNIVIATLQRQAGASNLYNKLTSEDEDAVVVLNKNNMYYVILGSYDTKEEAMEKIYAIQRKHSNISTESLMQTYGIPFRDFWILVNTGAE